eukprot:11313467-Alexandrium_andersonii.AAC.1
MGTLSANRDPGAFPGQVLRVALPTTRPKGSGYGTSPTTGTSSLTRARRTLTPSLVLEYWGAGARTSPLTATSTLTPARSHAKLPARPARPQNA